MKAKEKRVGTKAQIRAMKERERRIATAIFLSIILAMVALSGYFTYTILDQPSEQSSIEPSLQFKPENSTLQLKAAIVDQLSLTFPNQTFAETAAAMLTKAGYAVDYFSGEKVTVGFYENLPTHGYGLIILRAHSTVSKELAVCLFTSETYDRTKYISEQLQDQIAIAAYSPEELEKGITYFGVKPSLIKERMTDRFENTSIIMMGCEGLNNTSMARAFIEKGAKVYVSWTGSVTASHTDQATTVLLQHLIPEKQTPGQAVENTMNEVGPDPASNAVLQYYPLEIR